ncbi:effector-associated constant component EACC1 [Stackebrandtia nassauensis]|uniref:Uncharacterized protein n=1 Tax=Stackebrandtia nassauensis (strain DSM 44728 / CIP 108903 / NRRL B-16338 / NBRC 102104 / LLR-40K-21) TaxID=446470 RepID=D3Q919_STANL|nr:hypothetical protein [Stackebrandtia nassauensis]ADD40628.1 hypothetical protein Snas_0917 [Stackebrandtia nassauensis DSM 44728]
MVEVRISVAGGDRDGVELLAWLRRDPEARKVAIEPEPHEDGRPPDIIRAVINTVTQLGALVMAIVAFRATRSRSTCPQVSFTAASGARVLVQDADAETIKFVWDVINSAVPPQRS